HLRLGRGDVADREQRAGAHGVRQRFLLRRVRLPEDTGQVARLRLRVLAATFFQRHYRKPQAALADALGLADLRPHRQRFLVPAAGSREVAAAEREVAEEGEADGLQALVLGLPRQAQRL